MDERAEGRELEDKRKEGWSRERNDRPLPQSTCAAITENHTLTNSRTLLFTVLEAGTTRLRHQQIRSVARVALFLDDICPVSLHGVRGL